MVIEGVGQEFIKVVLDLYEAKAIIETLRVCNTYEYFTASEKVKQSGLPLERQDLTAMVQSFTAILGRFTDSIKVTKIEEQVPEQTVKEEAPQTWKN